MSPPEADGAPWSRRRFMTIGAGAAGAALLAALGQSTGEAAGATTTSSPQQSGSGAGGTTTTTPRRPMPPAPYRSRPDLRPDVVTVTGPGKGAGDGYFFVSLGGPYIVDSAGEPVWINPLPHGTTNCKVQTYQGEPVLTWWNGTVATWGVGTEGACYIADTSYRPIKTVLAGNGLQADLHEFLITPQGTAYITAYRELDADLSAVGGPTRGPMLDAVVQEIDLDSGAVLFEWHSMDHIALSESYQKYQRPKDGKPPYDPVHLNSIEPMDDGHLLLSARNTWTLYKVDPSTGDIVWRLGGKQSDFHLGPGVRFAWQHDARQHDGGVFSLFDDEAGPPEAPQSRGLFLHADEETMEATVVRQYRHPKKKILAIAEGSVQPLPNGNVVVGWGFEPYFTEFTRDGRVVVDAKFAKNQSYRAFRQEWTATPTDQPALAVTGSGSGRLTVYVSWNGATEVARWRVIGGSSPQALSALRSAPKAGFETTIPVRTTVAYLAVQALDAAGQVLGTSPVTKV